MNNTLFTLYYVLSGIHTHLDNVSIHPQQLTELPKLFFIRQFTAFANEWTSSLLCKYGRHANPAETFDQENQFWSHLCEIQ